MFHIALMGFQELWPILIIVLLLFGAKKLPELARSMGSSVNQFKKGMSDGQPETGPNAKPTTPKSDAANPQD